MPHAVEVCQRWRYGTPSWIRRRDGGFDRHRYRVVTLPEQPAKEFTLKHHYAASWPAARLRFGMLDLEDGTLRGVLVLGIPMHPAVLTRPLPHLEPYQQSLELSRLVLLDEVAANGESWFCAQAFRAAAERGVRGLVAFSDPVPRWRATPVGPQLFMPGHVGVVYQALGAAYTGRATARPVWMLPDGSSLSARSAAKVTAGDRGSAGVMNRLIAQGAPLPAPGQDPATWLTEARHQLGARKIDHPGNHRYVFRLGRTRADRRRVTIGLTSRPYPKQATQPVQLALFATAPGSTR